MLRKGGKVFTHDQLEEMIDLHTKSYALLKWVNHSLKQNTLKFDVMHQTMNASEAAAEWLRRHYAGIPLAIRPAEAKIEEFANFFSSYLTTSFDIIEKPGEQLRSYCGCFCPMCSYLSAADYLKVRRPSHKAYRRARALKRIYLASLGDALELPLIEDEIEQLLSNKELYLAISLTTYCNEQLRRTKFASQGEGVLVLWREIAWEGTAPKKGFRLEAEEILDAEKKIISVIQAEIYAQGKPYTPTTNTH